VVIEDGETLGVPVQREPLVGMVGAPPGGGARTELRLDLGQPIAVGGHADLAEGRGVRDGGRVRSSRPRPRTGTSSSSRPVFRPAFWPRPLPLGGGRGG